MVLERAGLNQLDDLMDLKALQPAPCRCMVDAQQRFNRPATEKERLVTVVALELAAQFDQSSQLDLLVLFRCVRQISIVGLHK